MTRGPKECRTTDDIFEEADQIYERIVEELYVACQTLDNVWPAFFAMQKAYAQLCIEMADICDDPETLFKLHAFHKSVDEEICKIFNHGAVQ